MVRSPWLTPCPTPRPTTTVRASITPSHKREASGRRPTHHAKNRADGDDPRRDDGGTARSDTLHADQSPYEAHMSTLVLAAAEREQEAAIRRTIDADRKHEAARLALIEATGVGQ